MDKHRAVWKTRRVRAEPSATRVGTVTFSGLGKCGQFGNQLFQIAAVFGYSRLYEARVALPRWYCEVSGTDYGDVFPNIKGYYGNSDNPVLYSEPNFAYSLIPFQTSIDLRGNFQSEKYFENATGEMRRIIKEPSHITEKIENYLKSISISDFNAIHVRVYSHPSKDNGYPVYRLPEYYFIEAMKVCSGFRKLLLVTDDQNYSIDLISRHGIKDVTVFPDYGDPLVDFFMLSRATKIAISNSSFSWWAAYLGKEKEAVFAPHRYFWFRPEFRRNPFWDPRDLYPPHFREVII